ncbi:MAG: STAS domain-containing protein [Bacteroidales bacterium]|nr:STAS domain-containing protein [Bacteroidales bacterium]
MKLEITTSGQFKIVKVDGRIDTTRAVEFESSVVNLIDQGCNNLIINCLGLNYISSSGLRVFLVLQKRLAGQQGVFRLCCLKPEIQEIFDISGFSTIFQIFPTEEAALAGEK